MSQRAPAFLWSIALFGILSLLGLPAHGQEKTIAPLLAKGDRVAWVGSSSTNIGVWPKTMEFLLRTRHPDLQLSFKKFSTGGGTFATGLQKLDGWLDDFKPTVVVLNYGSNDAARGGRKRFTAPQGEQRPMRGQGRGVQGARDLLDLPGRRCPQVRRDARGSA